MIENTKVKKKKKILTLFETRESEKIENVYYYIVCFKLENVSLLWWNMFTIILI